MNDAPKKVMGESAPNADWIALVQEEALEPDLEIVDPHHHLWERPGQRYLIPDLYEDMDSGHNIAATVFAECHSMYRQDGPEELKSLGETEFVAGCAAMGASGAYGPTRACAAMFGRVDMTLGAATRPIFEQHIERSGGRFKGIRFSTAWDASDKIRNVGAKQRLLLDLPVLEAASVMADMELTLDCWVYHPQLNDITILADAFPDLTIVLNHMGAPILGGPYRDKRDQVFEDWRKALPEVAKRPNVYLKLGAMPILRKPDADKSLPPSSDEVVEAWRPWLDVGIEAFGAERGMFESNYPVQKLWVGYGVIWNAFKKIAAGASADEKRGLFSGAAKAAYRMA